MSSSGPVQLTPAQLEQLVANNSTALARLNAHLQATIPIYIDEIATSPQVAPATPATLKIQPFRDTYFKVTGIYVSIPINSVSATLQLDDLILPIQNTTTLLSPVQKILRSTDLRQLSFETGSGETDGGTAFVWLWGEALPSYGKL